jgi:arabinofuranosyltransferase
MLADDTAAVERAAQEAVARRSGRLPALVLPALTVALVVGLGWWHRFSVDDAFINFRVVKQIEAGHGPVFNMGERVEVTTSTLWLAMLVAADLVSPLRIEWTAVLLEIGLTAAGVAAAMAGAVRLADMGRPEPRTDRWVVPVGALAYLAPAAAWDWASGGLENGLGIAWLGATFWAVVRVIDPAGASRRRAVTTAALVGVGVLVRPDFAVFAAAFAVPVAVAAWRGGRWRRLALAAGAALALPLAVQVFRMGYYGQLFPNTVYAKEGTRTWWDQGWRYLRDFAGSYALVVPVAVVALWLAATWRADRERGPGRRGRWLVIGATEAAALAHALVVTRAGGDYMHGRLLLPAWFCLLLPTAALPAVDLRARRGLLAAAALGVWALVAAVGLRAPTGSVLAARAVALTGQLGIELPTGRPQGISNVRPALTSVPGIGRAPVTADEMLPPNPPVDGGFGAAGGLFDPRDHPPGSGSELRVRAEIGRNVVPTYGLGVPAYVLPLDVWVYDQLGLADPVTSRLTLDWRGTPGHEKAMTGPWVAAVYLDPASEVDDTGEFMAVGFVAQLMSGIDTGDVPTDPAGFARARADAAAALGCGGLRERVYDARAPLTARRFLGNIVDAVRLDRLRVPNDPAEARRQLC